MTRIGLRVVLPMVARLHADQRVVLPMVASKILCRPSADTPVAEGGGDDQGDDGEEAEVVGVAAAGAGFVFSVVERDDDPDGEAGGEEQDADDLSGGAGQDVAEDLEHVEGRHEVPLGMNAGGCGDERVGLLAEVPGEDGREQGEDVERDEPHRQIFLEEVREEGDALAGGDRLGLFAGRDGVAVLLD